jgi:hypothetical protein
VADDGRPSVRSNLARALGDTAHDVSQNVDQEALDELGYVELWSCIVLALDATILDVEGYTCLVSCDEAAVRDGDAMGIA